MCEIKIKTDSEGAFFHLYDPQFTSGNCITDYSYLKNEIIVTSDNEIEIGDKKERRIISSTEKLKDVFDVLVTSCISILEENPYTIFDFTAIEINVPTIKQLLVEQLVFDVLYQKYLYESPLLTNYGYSTKIVENDHSLMGLKKDALDSLRKTISNNLPKHHDLYLDSDLLKDYKLLGIDPEEIDKRYDLNSVEERYLTNPEFVWDYLYINTVRLLGNQFKRTLNKDSNNYTYDELIGDLKEYNEFINKMFPVEYEEYKKYFNMIMKYYHIESYRRIDFIFKYLDSDISKKWSEIISNSNFLEQILPEAEKAITEDEKTNIILKERNVILKRFTPMVLVPVIKDGDIIYKARYKYYRPMLLIEEMLFNEEVNKAWEFIKFGSFELTYVIRAMAIEIFNYHFQFTSSNYKEIKEFLVKSYNLINYHKSVEIYNRIKNVEYNKKKVPTDKELKEKLNKFITVNKSLFWKRTKRNIKED